MPLSALAMVIVAGLLHAFWSIGASKTGGNRHFALMGGKLLGERDRGRRVPGAVPKGSAWRC